MILIEDRTKTKYDVETVEVWTYNMKLRFSIENARVKKQSDYYEIISYTGETIATFPANETAFMMKTPETNQQIIQTGN